MCIRDRVSTQSTGCTQSQVMEKAKQYLPQYSLFDTVYITLTACPAIVWSWFFYISVYYISTYTVIPLLGWFYSILLLIVIQLGLYAAKLTVLKPQTRAPLDYSLSSKTFGKSGKPIHFCDPATGESSGEFTSYTDDDVKEVVKRARVAQKSWGQTTFEERKEVLNDLMQYIIHNQDEICEQSMRDTGKTSMEAEYGEILTSCVKIKYLMDEGPIVLAPEHRSPPLWVVTKKAWVEYNALGVIGIIVPWNYPFHNVVSAVAAALFAGNAAVVKVSEYATASKDYFETIFRSILSRRGYNPELVTLIQGYGDTGEALIRAPVDKVLFIGSPGVGKKVMAAASDSLTPVILELGGKDPFIVLKDAHIDNAVDVALRGVFVNCGQNCIAAERLYIHSSIYNQFSSKIVEKVKTMRQGASIKGEECDCGSMTMPSGITKVQNLVDDAVSKGAVLLTGGKAKHDDAATTTDRSVPLFYDLTVLGNVNHTMTIANEEAFGPVMLLISFDDEDQVVEMANCTEYALGCSIFSEDRSRAEKLGQKIISGMVTVNDYGVSYMIQSLPFGGCKVSGFGRFNGPEGLRGFANVKSIVSDRWPIMTVPKFTKYPVPKDAKKVVKGLISVLFEDGISAKLEAVKVLNTHKELLG
eukprot:TRINITY_DN4611_c0_g1_i1.p1 TRINITY_DN4611_c0_g1~~TRINITY_DN4611_c0_g1_i1.p1  ORF type:complete len:641 (+),score=133.06 TRINITY_DN4611_c0_g1_i1:57-1979(+)